MPSRENRKQIKINAGDLNISGNFEDNIVQEIRNVINSAISGNAESQYKLAEMFNAGYGVPKNMEQCIYWTTQAAEQGHSDANHALGLFYYKGENVSKNLDKATKYLSIAAEKGDQDALNTLTQIARKNNAEVQFKIGKLIYNMRNENLNENLIFKNAMECFSKAASKGHSVAQFYLAMMHERGEGSSQNITEAVKLYRKSAENGYVFAQSSLGRIYFYGHGKEVPQNYNEALKWYTAAAEQGNPLAQFRLGEMYYCEIGVEKNLKEAFKWFKNAAEQNARIPQLYVYLGNMYYNGEGTRKSIPSAIKWLSKAATGHDYSSAQYSLGKILWDRRKDANELFEAVKLIFKSARQDNQDAIDFIRQNSDEIKVIVEKNK